VIACVYEHGNLEKSVPQNMSLAFSVALRLVKKSNDLSLYLDRQTWNDSEVLSIVDKIQLTVGQQRQGEQSFSAGVTIKLSGGRQLQGEQPYPRGSIQNPLTWNELTEKFSQLASNVLPVEKIDQIVNTVRALPAIQDVSVLIPMLTNPKAVS